MSQKILKVGSSAAITISRDALNALGVDIGDKVKVEVGEGKSLLVSPAVEVDRELLGWTQGFIKKYKKALDELAD
jgi:antitoxin component of MazEF toxin-antitoxin module